MKKILYLLTVPFLLSLALVSCETDNYDGPNAKIAGKFLDAATGDLIGTDIQNGNAIRVYEQGWTSESAQTWNVKNTGEYQNDLVFAGDYRVEFINCNFYPFGIDKMTVNKGMNTQDFSVTPYVRVKNPSITYDATSGKVIAKFNLEGGKPEVELNEVRLFAFTDNFVGNNVRFNISDAAAVKKIDGPIATTQYELSIDVNQYKNMYFQYSRNYYFRIGALGKVTSVGTVRHNYSPLVVIKL